MADEICSKFFSILIQSTIEPVTDNVSMIILPVWKSQALKSLAQKYPGKSTRYQFESLPKQWKCSQDCVQVL